MATTGDNLDMAGKPKKDDALAAYRRVRKPIAPPAKVIPDRRRKALDEQRRREAEQERDEP